MKNIFIALFAILVLFASCKIKTHIHFNKDNSGKVMIEYDMGGFLAESGGKDSTGFIDSMAMSLKQLDSLGLMKNYKVEKTITGILVSYNFENIEQLNHSFDKFLTGDSQMEKATGKYTASRNKLKYELNNPEKENEEDIISSTEMDGLFEWEYKVSFEKMIKKCSNANYELSDDKHSMLMKGSLSTFQDPEKMNFNVKLK